jgi:hypothetical protein
MPCGGGAAASGLMAGGGAVNAVRFHPVNTNLLIVGRVNKSVWLLNASTGRCAATASSRVYMAGFAHSGEYIIVDTDPHVNPKCKPHDVR